MSANEYDSTTDSTLLVRAGALESAFSRYHEKYMANFLTNAEIIDLVEQAVQHSLTPSGDAPLYVTDDTTVGQLSD